MRPVPAQVAAIREEMFRQFYEHFYTGSSILQPPMRRAFNEGFNEAYHMMKRFQSTEPKR